MCIVRKADRLLQLLQTGAKQGELPRNNPTNMQISVYDRIIEVNGLRASGKELASFSGLSFDAKL